MQYICYATAAILGLFVLGFACSFITRVIGRAWFRARWEMWNVYKTSKKEK